MEVFLNSTSTAAHAVLGAQSLLSGSAPVLAGVVALALSGLWLLSGSGDDWAKLPGPPPASWLTGHLPQINVLKVHHFWQDAAQKYGPIFRVRLLNMRVVVLSDPGMIQAVLQRGADPPKAKAFYDAVDELFSPKGIRSFFNTHDKEEWKLVRKATAPAFSPATIRRAFPRLISVINELCDAVAARVAAGDDTLQATDAAMRVTLDVIGDTGFGYEFNARSLGRCELLECIPPLLAQFTLRATNPLKVLAERCLPCLPEARAFNRNVEICHKWWRTLCASVRAVDLQAAAAEGDTSLRVCLAKLPFDDDRLMPNVAAYLIAGFETTAHSIAWSLYEVASNPSVQARLEAELAGAGLLGHSARPLEFGDLAALPYLNAVLKEALRLHPVAANGTIRQLDREYSLGGYRLAANTVVWVPLIAALTSQHNWQRAGEFWPERWELEGREGAGAGAVGPTPLGNAANPGKTFVPFSDGPRDCIGQNLAMMEARAMVACVVGRFRLGVAPEMGSRADVRADECMKLTLQTGKGILLKLSPRE